MFECRLLNIIKIDWTKKSDVGELFFSIGAVAREPMKLYSVVCMKMNDDG